MAFVRWIPFRKIHPSTQRTFGCGSCHPSLVRMRWPDQHVGTVNGRRRSNRPPEIFGLWRYGMSIMDWRKRRAVQEQVRSVFGCYFVHAVSFDRRENGVERVGRRVGIFPTNVFIVCGEEHVERVFSVERSFLAHSTKVPMARYGYAFRCLLYSNFALGSLNVVDMKSLVNKVVTLYIVFHSFTAFRDLARTEILYIKSTVFDDQSTRRRIKRASSRRMREKRRSINDEHSRTRPSNTIYCSLSMYCIFAICIAMFIELP